MTILVCKSCSAKVESNRCCNNPMSLKDSVLTCKSCGKTVEVNRCCNQSMSEAQ